MSSKQPEASPASTQAAAKPEAGEKKEKLKPCCACPETRKVRDECIIENGEADCTALINAHKECLRKLGFNI